MSTEDFDLGLRLRSVRLACGLSQRELARMAGVTNGMISQLEKNRSSPSISSLKRILDAIPMSLSNFLNENNVVPEVDALKAATHAHHHHQMKARLLQVAPIEHPQLEMRQDHYPVGADTGEQPRLVDAEEAGIVIAGQIEITHDGAARTLNAGEGYILKRRTACRFRNIGTRDCFIISACAAPA